MKKVEIKRGVTQLDRLFTASPTTVKKSSQLKATGKFKSLAKKYSANPVTTPAKVGDTHKPFAQLAEKMKATNIPIKAIAKKATKSEDTLTEKIQSLAESFQALTDRINKSTDNKPTAKPSTKTKPTITYKPSANIETLKQQIKNLTSLIASSTDENEIKHLRTTLSEFSSQLQTLEHQNIREAVKKQTEANEVSMVAGFRSGSALQTRLASGPGKLW